jgi:hypothetical protein
MTVNVPKEMAIWTQLSIVATCHFLNNCTHYEYKYQDKMIHVEYIMNAQILQQKLWLSGCLRSCLSAYL